MEGICLTFSQVSCKLNKPVRVIRGYNLNSKHALLVGFVVGNLIPMARNSC